MRKIRTVRKSAFIEDGDDYKAFLKRNGYDLPKGDFVDADGNILGEHQGILNYTIGQRKGLESPWENLCLSQESTVKRTIGGAGR